MVARSEETAAASRVYRVAAGYLITRAAASSAGEEPLSRYLVIWRSKVVP